MSKEGKKETRLSQKYGLDPGETVTDALGRKWQPRIVDGKPLVRLTRPGDRFLARSKRVRIVECSGPHFRGLLRLIVEPVE